MQTKICKYCNKEFIPSKSRHDSTKTTQKYCSNECKQKARCLKNKQIRQEQRRNYHEEYLRTRGKSGAKLKCVNCGQSFTAKTNHPKFCSDGCRIEFRNKQAREKRKEQHQEIIPITKVCPVCNEEFKTINYLGKNPKIYCSHKCSAAYLYKHPKGSICICKQCGKEFISKVNAVGMYCSRLCNDIGRKNKSIEKQIIKQNFKHKYICIVCGKEFENRIKLQRICCSYDCIRKYEHSRFLIYKESGAYKSSIDKKREEYRSKLGLVFIKKSCVECGKEFETILDRQICCSVKCGKQNGRVNGKAKRRLRIVNNGYERISIQNIVNKNGYVCGICGKFINKELTNNHMYELTLDHIIPLARGGEHRESNLQLAHRICNSYKSDKVNYAM